MQEIYNALHQLNVHIHLNLHDFNLVETVIDLIDEETRFIICMLQYIDRLDDR